MLIVVDTAGTIRCVSNCFRQNLIWWPCSRSNSVCAFRSDLLQAWMAQEGYSNWYLFLDSDKCCKTYFPLSTNCPYETTPQTGYYWEHYHPERANNATVTPFYNHSFYPDLASGTCINGTDYPSWSECFWPLNRHPTPPWQYLTNFHLSLQKWPRLKIIYVCTSSTKHKIAVNTGLAHMDRTQVVCRVSFRVIM
jgi:hypothetical protein